MSYELLNFYQFCDNYKIPSYTDRVFDGLFHNFGHFLKLSQKS